jgi:propionyl-CoA synthetase
MSEDYRSVYRFSVEQPVEFWEAAAKELAWSKPWDEVLDASQAPMYRWFPGGKINTCYNALDRHVEAGNGERTALIYDSPVTNTKATYSYSQLLDEVSRFAGALAERGVSPGSRVIIYMPMIPQTVIAMLACARIGAIHSVVFGGFAADELATRIRDCEPTMILTASCGIEPGRVVEYKPLLDAAIDAAGIGQIPCIVFQRPECQASLVAGRDEDWAAIAKAAQPVSCVALDATDPLYILYTSGTTGEPKGVVRDNGGHAVALNWSMPNIYGIKPGDVFWAASDVGWVVGHSYIVYAPLISGCTTVLYEGKPVGTPDAGAFWRVVSEYGVNCLFTAPTAFRAIRRDDPAGELLHGYDLSSLRTLFLAGERCDPGTLEWAQSNLGIPVIDHWWQTETGWPVAANCVGIELLPVKPGSPTCAVPGYRVAVLDESGEPVAAGETGNIVIGLPLPPGTLPTLWKKDDRYRSSYLERYPGYYLTGDSGYCDSDGYLWIMSRIDDIINVAGHRLSTGQMEEVLASFPNVAECAVIGVEDSLKGQLPLGLVVMQSGADVDEEEIRAGLVRRVREVIGPVAAFKLVTIVDRLPKTRSGKVLRGTMKKIADGQQFKIPATIDDPASLAEIERALAGLGYPGDS